MSVCSPIIFLKVFCNLQQCTFHASAESTWLIKVFTYLQYCRFGVSWKMEYYPGIQFKQTLNAGTCCSTEWDQVFINPSLIGPHHVLCFLHFKPCICPLYCPSPSHLTDFLWATPFSQKLRKNWLSLKYKQMGLFSSTSKRAFEVFMYTLFVVQTLTARQF